MLECHSSPESFARELEMASCVHRRYLRNITNHIGDESGSDGYVSQDSLIDCSDDEQQPGMSLSDPCLLPLLCCSL